MPNSVSIELLGPASPEPRRSLLRCGAQPSKNKGQPILTNKLTENGNVKETSLHPKLTNA